MAIERSSMAENTPGVGDAPTVSVGVTATGPEGVVSQEVAAPNVVIAPERRQRGILSRLLKRSPQPQVLVESEDKKPISPESEVAESKTPKQSITEDYDPARIGEYTMETQGQYAVAIDPKTGKEVARVPRIEGGAPAGPERGPEWETSPERGREIVNEIIRLETTPSISYTERYKLKVADSPLKPEYLASHSAYTERNGIYLDQLYKDLQDYTRAVRRVRNIRDPWDPGDAYRKITKALERRARGEQPEANQLGVRVSQKGRGERPAVLPAEPIDALFEKYKGQTNAEAVEGDMATWFQEARNFGLLDRADAFFTLFHRQLLQGNISAGQVEEELVKIKKHARRSIESALRGSRTDSRVAPLRGIADAYATRTYDIFDKWLRGEQYAPIEGEFRFSTDDSEIEDTETYWRPGHYPKLYEIIAKTKRQFIRAKNSFLSKITGGALGDSPDELYEHFNNFNEKFRQTAGSTEGIDDDFIKDSSLEIGGRGFVFGGDYSLETYNMRSANQFLMAMALNKGPQRWAAVARSGNGEVYPHLWKFDYDPRVKLMHNPGGSRGQLLNDTVTQHCLHMEIRSILIEEGMGVVMKEYDPRDEQSVDYNPQSIRVLNLKEAEEARERALAANVARIGLHQPVEELKGLYEGFDNGNAHLINARKYEGLNDDQLKTLSPALRRSVIVGRVQSLLLGRNRKNKIDNKDQLIGVIDDLIEEGRLTPRDKRFWEEAYDHSRANFATAFQMVGASGEKARRGGGVFFVDRKDANDRRIVDNIPVYLGEMFVQYAENRTKIEFSNESSFWDKKDGFNDSLKKTKKDEEKEPGFIEVTYKDGTKDKLRTKAAYRTYKVRMAREDAINQIKTNGFEAALKFPKLKFNTVENSPNFGDVVGVEDDQTEEVGFETATDPKNILNRWLNHTYLSYQPEHRHQVTNPDVLKAAKRRRIALLRPDLLPGLDQNALGKDQYENLADLRLILEPTLNRVLSLQDTDMPEGMAAQQAEILLSDAAVEASNMSHWRIVRELSAAFMSKDGNLFKMRTGYNLEDYSGIARVIIRMRQFVASNPKRFARRYAAEIANLPLNVSSMPDQWGQAGVTGAIEMFVDPVGAMSEQREASQFAITKWVEQMRIGNLLYDALVGHVDSEKGFSIEGLFEKPLNSSHRVGKIEEILDRLERNAKGGVADYSAENQFMDLVEESFDRLWIVLKLVRTMESDTRNSQGALDLEKKDFLVNGKVDAQLLEILAKDNNTGSSRHTEEQFFNAYIDWLIRVTEGGGGQAYPGELQWYKLLTEKTILDPAPAASKMTRAQWLFRRMSR